MPIIDAVRRRIAASLPRGSGKRAVAVVAFGSIVGQASALLASPLLTRIYGPAEFGLLAVYSGILTISVGFAGLRYEQAIPIAESELEARVLAMIAAVITAVMAPLIGFFGNAYASNVASVAIPWMVLIPVGFTALGFYQILSLVAVRHRQYALVARTRAAQGLSMTLVQLGLGVLGVGPVGLLGGHVLGQAAGVVSLLSHAMSTARFRWVGLGRVRETLYKFRKFPKYSVWSSVLNSAGLQAPSLLIAWRYGVDVAGVFMLAQRVTEVPMRLLGQSVNQVFFAEIAALRRNGSPAGLELLKRTTRALSRIGIPPLIALGVLAPVGAASVFGVRWSEVGVLVPLMLPVVAAQFIASPAAQMLVAHERQEMMMIWDGSRVAVVLLALGVLPAMHVDPRLAIAIYSATGAVLYAILYRLAIRVATNEMPNNSAEAMND